MADRGNILRAGQALKPGDWLISPNKKYKFLFQESDRNIVLSEIATDKAIWTTNTHNVFITTAEMQTDGNFVLKEDNKPIRSSRTDNHHGAHLELRDDGLLVIIGPIWYHMHDLKDG